MPLSSFAIGHLTSKYYSTTHDANNSCLYPSERFQTRLDELQTQDAHCECHGQSRHIAEWGRYCRDLHQVDVAVFTAGVSAPDLRQFSEI